MFKPLSLRFRGVAAGIIPIDATGGDEIFDYEVPGTDEAYRYHVFLNSDSFVVNNLSNIYNDLEVLVVAGGGGGGAGDNETEAGCGAGGGGVREIDYSLSSPGTYLVTVGAGGAGRGSTANCIPGLPGEDSVFDIHAAAGGGEGLAARGGAAPDGGSGGGAQFRSASAGSGNVPAVSPSQGNDGYRYSGGNNGGGGGGFAAAAVNYLGGAGGTSTIFPKTLSDLYFDDSGTRVGVVSGSSVLYSAGGRGGTGTSRYGPTAGNPYTGDGGDGGYAQGESAGGAQVMPPGKNGGSGVVIVKYRIQ